MQREANSLGKLLNLVGPAGLEPGTTDYESFRSQGNKEDKALIVRSYEVLIGET